MGEVTVVHVIDTFVGTEISSLTFVVVEGS